MTSYSDYTSGKLLRGRYRFVRQIQHGAFGHVLEAVDVETSARVALKAAAKELHVAAKLARHEIAVLRKLGKHPNICQMLDLFETDLHVVLVLEYLPHGDLYDRAHELGVTLLEVAEIAAQVAAALRHAHSMGIAHRDIKPENIMFGMNMEVKLGDWGLAHVEGMRAERDVGTEKYMAPECHSSAPHDPRPADVWLLGITVLFALFGHTPWKNLRLDSTFKLFEGHADALYDVFPLTARCMDAVVRAVCVDAEARDVEAFVELLKAGPLTMDEEYEMLMVFDMESEGEKEQPVVADRSHRKLLQYVVLEHAAPLLYALDPFLLPAHFSFDLLTGKSWTDIEDDDDDLLTRLEALGFGSKTSHAPVAAGRGQVAVEF